jgi:hypothetical protein
MLGMRPMRLGGCYWQQAIAAALLAPWHYGCVCDHFVSSVGGQASQPGRHIPTCKYKHSFDRPLLDQAEQ